MKVDDTWNITYGSVSVKVDEMEYGLMADELPDVDVPVGMMLVGLTSNSNTKDVRYAFAFV